MSTQTRIGKPKPRPEPQPPPDQRSPSGRPTTNRLRTRLPGVGRRTSAAAATAAGITFVVALNGLDDNGAAYVLAAFLSAGVVIYLLRALIDQHLPH